ncbi:MAG: hypothetical protein JO212_01005 [Acetobacteraceae bacterium]|nr:hypothetical protein [Acetobacteraceae bacterium]
MDFLFVQTAKSMRFDKGTGKLALEGVSPITLFFSDRPERIAGNMRTAKFVSLWSDGKHSFRAEPPNADVSIIEGDALRQVVVELRDPVLNADSLSYAAKVLEGEAPSQGSDVSVFVDVFGMPLTPISYAGFARRAWRRGYWR